jgi:hypothetical protein
MCDINNCPEGITDCRECRQYDEFHCPNCNNGRYESTGEKKNNEYLGVLDIYKCNNCGAKWGRIRDEEEED